jgi:PiT family inorganic phosphate transporter
MKSDSVLAFDRAGLFNPRDLFRLGLGILFIVLVMIYAKTTVGSIGGGPLLIVAAMIGGYMAMNIGANDVANAVGPLAAIYDAVITGAHPMVVGFARDRRAVSRDRGGGPAR